MSGSGYHNRPGNPLIDAVQGEKVYGNPCFNEEAKFDLIPVVEIRVPDFAEVSVYQGSKDYKYFKRVIVDLEIRKHCFSAAGMCRSVLKTFPRTLNAAETFMGQRAFLKLLVSSDLCVHSVDGKINTVTSCSASVSLLEKKGNTTVTTAAPRAADCARG